MGSPHIGSPNASILDLADEALVIAQAPLGVQAEAVGPAEGAAQGVARAVSAGTGCRVRELSGAGSHQHRRQLLDSRRFWNCFKGHFN